MSFGLLNLDDPIGRCGSLRVGNAAQLSGTDQLTCDVQLTWMPAEPGA